MKKRYIFILGMILAVLSVSAVSAGLLDGLLSGEPKDTVVELDNIQFNTTNVSDFKLYNETDGWKIYMTENTTGYTVHIYDFDKNEETLQHAMGNITEEYKNQTNQTVNGTVIYKISADTGEHVGETRYITFVENKDLNMLIGFGTPDANETVKMASTLKFNDK